MYNTYKEFKEGDKLYISIYIRLAIQILGLIGSIAGFISVVLR